MGNPFYIRENVFNKITFSSRSALKYFFTPIKYVGDAFLFPVRVWCVGLYQST